MSPIDAKSAEEPSFAAINVTAHGDRRKLESVYLELRELAKRNGLKIDYRLTQTDPKDQAGS